jgi:hypothetical protein
MYAQSHLRFFKRIHLLPWVTLNSSKSGVSLTLGPIALHWTIVPRGNTARWAFPAPASTGLGMLPGRAS